MRHRFTALRAARNTRQNRSATSTESDVSPPCVRRLLRVLARQQPTATMPPNGVCSVAGAPNRRTVYSPCRRRQTKSTATARSRQWASGSLSDRLMSSDPRYAEWTLEQIWQAKVPDDHEVFTKGVSPGKMIQRYAQARGFRPAAPTPAAAAASSAPAVANSWIPPGSPDTGCCCSILGTGGRERVRNSARRPRHRLLLQHPRHRRSQLIQSARRPRYRLLLQHPRHRRSQQSQPPLQPSPA